MQWTGIPSPRCFAISSILYSISFRVWYSFVDKSTRCIEEDVSPSKIGFIDDLYLDRSCDTPAGGRDKPIGILTTFFSWQTRFKLQVWPRKARCSCEWEFHLFRSWDPNSGTRWKCRWCCECAFESLKTLSKYVKANQEVSWSRPNSVLESLVSTKPNFCLLCRT